ncbi:hypothetical protein Pla110_08900 [Polystyrenella longa]|uniref:Uncharacterized protein n=1 Tax=Polystyrenella longa TaxID=2528007 RepID=A0A518CIY1_9PLAN|nr:hypothetical protein Pla110_08900 [Polystyrenella longa]
MMKYHPQLNSESTFQNHSAELLNERLQLDMIVEGFR